MIEADHLHGEFWECEECGEIHEYGFVWEDGKEYAICVCPNQDSTF